MVWKKTPCSGKRHEESGTALDPELLRLLAALDINLDHEGLTSANSLSAGVVVSGALIHVLQRFGTFGNGAEVNNGHGAEELHNLRFHEVLLVVVPLGTFKEETADESTVLGQFLDVGHGARRGDEIEVQLVDRRALVVLASELLQQSRGETGRVGVGTDPVGQRRHMDLVSPVLEEAVPFGEVDEPVGQTLEGEVSEGPLGRHDVLRQALHHDFQIGRDHNCTLDTLFELF